jgi:predicted DNA-binding protein (MmcQ/YjbR family)
MTKDIHQAVREVCLSFPEAEEFDSHGSPNFRVRGKTFANYVINHHGDGRIALWLPAADGVQDHYTRTEPKYFFVPPYVGPRGWIGVHLNKKLSWNRIAELVRASYEKVAPAALSRKIGTTIAIKPPVKTLAPEDIDPWQNKKAQSLLKAFRKICLALPETSEDSQFGSPVWRAGKKVFAIAHARQKKVQFHFWVGVDRQNMFTLDKRYQIPPYIGHNGWIALDVLKSVNWDEVRELTLGSYQHFALRRMLASLPGSSGG